MVDMGNAEEELDAAAAYRVSVECFAAQHANAPLTPWSYELVGGPGAGEVDVVVTHCGVCHSDVHQLADDWRSASFPLVPGHEIVGVVAAVGSAAQLAVGDLVGIGPQRSSCGACRECLCGCESVCPRITKTYAGPTKAHGGFARYIRFPAAWCFRVPDNLRSEHAAPLLCAGVTTFAPLKRYVQSPETTRVGVVGVGGLGHIAIQYASKMGCTVTAVTGNMAAKGAEARSFGASAVLDTSDLAAARGSLDLVLCTACGRAPWDALVDLLAPRGTFVLLGLPPKDTPMELLAHSLVLQEKTLAGSFLGGRAVYDEALAFAAEHGVAPVVEVLPLEHVNDAIKRVVDGSVRYRAVLEM